MSFSFTDHGSFDKMEKFLRQMERQNFRRLLEEQGRKGVQALAMATPRDAGIAAQSWGYTIRQNRGGVTITWTNSNVENGFPVAIMLQYGHGTGTGGYVQGRDYINPAMKPIFDEISNKIWKAVTSA